MPMYVLVKSAEIRREWRPHHDHIQPDHLYMGAVAVLGVFGRVGVEKWRLRLYASKTGVYG